MAGTGAGECQLTGIIHSADRFRTASSAKRLSSLESCASLDAVETGHSPPTLARLTDTLMCLKVITPRLNWEMTLGDIVQAGVVVSNSEVGRGTLSMQPLLYRLRFRNAR